MPEVPSHEHNPAQRGGIDSIVAKGSGELSIQLSHLKSHLQALESDEILPDRARDELRKYYRHECDKVQAEIALLGQAELVRVKEEEDKSAAQAVEFAGSEAGQKRARELWQKRAAGMALGAGTRNAHELAQIPDDPEEHELSRARRRATEARLALTDVRFKMKVTSESLATLRLDDAKWSDTKAEADRWEGRQRWETVTPEELRPAVRAIRKAFEDRCWELEQSTMKLCYAALHPGEGHSDHSGEEGLGPYRQFLTRALGAPFAQSLAVAGEPPSQVFRAYLDAYQLGLKAVARSAFRDLFDIGKAKTTMIAFHPADWAKKQVGFLISALKIDVRNWIKNVCDKHVLGKAAFDDEQDLHWGSWRAPQFMHMKPAGNAIYDATKAWNREELAETVRLLDGRAERFVTFLMLDLETTVGVAHVEMAKRVDSSALASRTEPIWEKPPQDQKTGLSVDGVPSIQKWAALREKFSALAQEELTRDPHNYKDRWLRAYVEYREGDSPCGQWHISEGVNEAFRERFMLEATKAGLALESPLRGDPRDFWLHHVFLDLTEHKSKLLLGEHKDTGGIITRICEASSIYCARLERAALANSRVHLGSPSPPVSGAPSGGVSQDTLLQRDNRLERRKAVIIKVRDPERFTVLSIAEAGLYFEVGARTIYRWLNTGKLRSGGRRGTVIIESVIRFEKARSRKPRSAS